MGADFIEPDLVSTKDGVLIARHENEISGTTDVKDKFPARKTKKTIDGVVVEGWFTEDLTLKEIKTLRARERLPFRDQSRNGKFQIPTFIEVLKLAKERGVGVYPETKHPTYFRSIGLALEPKLVAQLEAFGLNQPDAKIFVQSFEVANLKELKGLLKVPLIQLLGDPNEQPYDIQAAGGQLTYGEMIQPNGLVQVATYAAGIGPAKELVLGAPGNLVQAAHCAGLKVHPYTFRSDKEYLPAEYSGDPAKEYRRFFELGVDGVFSDFPDAAVRARSPD
jgi:glycerophosphoryl diester phosphodiesterase